MQFTIATNRAARQADHRRNRFTAPAVRLWVVQGFLAALFLFAGATKLAMSADELTANTWLSAEFLRFIGICEILGAAGLVLPGILRIRRELTPLAAAGLVVIMVGATTLTVAAGDFLPAAFPFVTGVLCLYVARARSRQPLTPRAYAKSAGR